MNRLKGNISKILDRVDDLEDRLNKIDTEKQVAAVRDESLTAKLDQLEELERRLNEIDTEKKVADVRDEALIAKFEAAMRATSAETHARFIERIVRLEILAGAKTDVATKRINSSEENNHIE